MYPIERNARTPTAEERRSRGVRKAGCGGGKSHRAGGGPSKSAVYARTRSR
jgi:hypothetical protein